MADRSVDYATIVAVQQERIATLTSENVMLTAALREADNAAAASPEVAPGDLPFVPASREPDPGTEG